MSLFDACLVGNDEELSIPIEDEFDALGSETNNRAVVDNDVGEKGIRVLVGIFSRLLVELEFGHSESAKHHEWAHGNDNEGKLPAEENADSCRNGHAEGSLD